jgi:DNA replication protein DnaC
MKLELVRENGRECMRRVIEPADLLLWAKVPLRFRARVLSGTWLKTDATDAATRLDEGEGLLAVLSGSIGCGKSFAAATLLSKRRGLWVHAPDLSRIPDDDEPQPERDMIAAGLLVLDDVGIEHSPSGYAASRVSDVVEAREANLRPTVITTNLDGEGFRKRYGPRLASRINGDGIGFVVCTGRDLRIRSGLRAIT